MSRIWDDRSGIRNHWSLILSRNHCTKQLWPIPVGTDDDHDDDHDDDDARSVKELAGSARHTNRLFPPTPLPTLYTSYECSSYTAVRLHVYLDFVKSIEEKL